jgi:hypothetical protein
LLGTGLSLGAAQRHQIAPQVSAESAMVGATISRAG